MRDGVKSGAGTTPGAGPWARAAAEATHASGASRASAAEPDAEAFPGKHPPTCPVEAALRLIGGKYKGLILWHLTGGAMRYGALSRLVRGATPKMLTQQLRELERDGLIAREVFPVVPPRVEYSLTASGETLSPVLHALYDWGVAHMERNGWPVLCSMGREEAAQGAE